ncbi:MAG: hypothetical protein AAGC80_33770 [Rhodococcus sp. (in: high G+C Gram-positive bacteria)]
MRLIDTEGSEPELVHETNTTRVWVMDSIAFASRTHAGDVIVTGSHGGTSAGEYAADFGVSVVVCNDAGIGKNRAGLAGLEAVAAQGIVGIAVSHHSARIGDGSDTWSSGAISYVNAAGEQAGVRTGRPVRDEILALVDRRGS